MRDCKIIDDDDDDGPQSLDNTNYRLNRQQTTRTRNGNMTKLREDRPDSTDNGLKGDEVDNQNIMGLMSSRQRQQLTNNWLTGSKLDNSGQTT